MGVYRDDIVKQAQAWLGKKEADGSHKSIIDIYNKHKPLARGYTVKYTDAWCATFVSAVAIAQNATAAIPTECSCNKMIELFKKLGCWVENDAYTPQPGDIIFYDWDDSGAGENTGSSDHVGIVVRVSSTVITVIEGNYGNAVKERKLAVNGKYIRGFGVPKYWVKTQTSKPVEKPQADAALKVGDTVIVKRDSRTYDNRKLASFVYRREHKIKEIKGDRVVITYNGVVVAAIHKDNLTKV